MMLRCPACCVPSLRIRVSSELGPDGDDDERSVQALECDRCGLQGLGIYRESRRGSGGCEHVSHVCYRIDAQTFDELAAYLRDRGGQRRRGPLGDGEAPFRYLDDDCHWRNVPVLSRGLPIGR